MSTLELELREDKLKKYVIISLVAHGLFFLSFMINNLLFTPENIDYSAAIKVDLIALPDKLPEEAAPIPQVQEPPSQKEQKTAEPTVKKEDAVNLDKTKSKQKDALAKLKQMSALEEIEKSLKEESKARPKTQHKGNVISPGTALTGLNKIQQENYIATVDQHFRSRWALPEYLRNRNLKTQVLVRFDENGNIISKEILKTSGNNVFDEIVLSTVEKSSPVPLPPEKFSQISKVQGFLFSFSE